MSRRNFCELDLSDIPIVQNSADLLDGYQRAMHEAAFSPYKLNDEAFTSQYYETAALVINAQPAFMRRYCRCGMSGDNRRRHWCNQWKYCVRCAREKGRELLKKYGHLYSSGNWQLLTMSFSGAVGYHDHRDLCNDLWRLLDAEYKRIEPEWFIEGAFYAEELKILSFIPAACMPHAHVLLDSEEVVGAAQTDELTAAINARLQADRRLSTLSLGSDVHVKAVESEEHFQNVLPYLTKPIDLSDPYRAALVSHEPIIVNSNARDVIVGLSNVGVGRKHIRYRGHISSNSAGYQGNQSAVGRRSRGRRRRRIALSPAQLICAREREDNHQIALAE